MRVVQVGKYYYPYVGGIESHLYTLCNELCAEEDIDLDVVVSNTKPRTERDVYRGVSVTRCAAIGHMASTTLSPTMVFELSQRAYDVLHLHLPHPVGVASYLASRKQREHRLIVSYHSDVVRQRRLLGLYEPLVDKLLARADAVIATSPNYVESSQVLQRHRAKCVVVPYGIDETLFGRTAKTDARAAEIRARYGGASLLLGVGRLVYYKGFEFAVRAMPSIPNAHLVLIGSGPLRADLLRLATELGVGDRVHLVGAMQNDDVIPYYYASDVYLLPSIARSEAFGIVQLEAMSTGLPVINTNLASGVPYVSRHGESGLTVPPENPAALANAVNQLLASPQLCRRMGDAGRQRVTAEFRKDVLARRVRALYARDAGSALD